MAVGYERKREVKGIFKIFNLNRWVIRVAEIGKSASGAGFDIWR